jgi:2-hydroxychromene-2-carboxylate isomerase
MPILEIYWSFRSPYSYIACDRLLAIKRDYDLDTDFRPVRPLALREPDFFSKGRKQFVPYLLKDVFRESERLGVPMTWPNPDPIKMDLASGVVDPDQPIITRLMELGVAACDAGLGLEFATAIGRRVWSGSDGWFTEETLSEAAQEAGVALVDLDRRITDNAMEIDKTIARNEAAQLEHHWGVPLMVLDGEPFFGQDRLDALVWRLNKLGLRRD